MRIILVLLFLISQLAIAQSEEMQYIHVTIESGGEPPTNLGTKTVNITFEPNKKKDFVAKKYTLSHANRKSIKEVKLKESLLLEADKVQKYQEWKDKKTFSLSEIGLSWQEVQNVNSEYKTYFPIQDTTTIQLDTFQVCKEAQWRGESSIIIGGSSMKVLFYYKNGDIKEVSLDSSILKNNSIDLNTYFSLKHLFNGVFSADFSVNSFFDKAELLDMVCFYYYIRECEGFYYREFMKKNPERSPQENRQMKDWDFKAYLKNRKS